MKNLYIFLIFSSITCFAQQEKSLKLYDIVEYSDTLSWAPYSSNYQRINDTLEFTVPQNEIWIISSSDLVIDGSGQSTYNSNFDYGTFINAPGFCLDGRVLVNWKEKYKYFSNYGGFIAGLWPSTSVATPFIDLRSDDRIKLFPGSHEVTNRYRCINWVPRISYFLTIEKYKFE